MLERWRWTSSTPLAGSVLMTWDGALDWPRERHETVIVTAAPKGHFRKKVAVCVARPLPRRHRPQPQCVKGTQIDDLYCRSAPDCVATGTQDVSVSRDAKRPMTQMGDTDRPPGLCHFILQRAALRCRGLPFLFPVVVRGARLVKPAVSSRQCRSQTG